jgi:hypothetical protein
MGFARLAVFKGLEREVQGETGVEDYFASIGHSS